MRTDIKVTRKELERLFGLPSSVFKLYFCLRQAMDFNTGYVGKTKGSAVYWTTIGDEMYIEPHQGLVDSGKPDKNKLKRWLQWLVKSGLVVNETVGSKLIFLLPLASSGKSVQNKPDPIPTPQADPIEGLSNSFNNNRLDDYCAYSEHQDDPHKTPKVDPVPVRSNNSKVSSNTPRAHVDRKHYDYYQKILTKLAVDFPKAKFTAESLGAANALAMFDQWNNSSRVVDEQVLRATLARLSARANVHAIHPQFLSTAVFDDVGAVGSVPVAPSHSVGSNAQAREGESMEDFNRRLLRESLKIKRVAK